jgi:MoaA/NifB/PqqE/SkfB family radical SAM enzyme
MMRVPPRLTWDLTRVRILQKLLGPGRHPLALRIDLAALPAKSEIPSDGGSNPPVENSSRDLQALALVRGSTAPLVWIGGDTPLHYPRVGQITRDIVNRGRTVFIEMDGTLLRRRIHEFRPVPGLYLVLALNGLEAAHDLRAGRPGKFRATVESIRTAKLSGFHICVETHIAADMELNELRALGESIARLDVDGWIHTRAAGEGALHVSQESLEAAREVIPSAGWRKFSEVLDLTPLERARFENKKAARIEAATNLSGMHPARESGQVHEAHEEGLRSL